MKSSWRGDDNVWSFVRLAYLFYILFDWNTAKEGGNVELRHFEVTTNPLKILVYLMGELSCVANHNALMILVCVIRLGMYELQHRDYKYCCFSES